MTLRLFVHLFLSVCILSNSFLSAEDQDRLKKTDINKIMEQIFKEHLGQKQIDEKILQQSFKTYIEQFDPDRTYLLQFEIKPFMQLSQAEMKDLILKYKSGNYTSFDKLNDLIQKTIIRSREIRKELLKNPDLLFKEAENFKETKNGQWLDANSNPLYAENLAELKKRIREQMIRFIQAEQKRYGKDQILKYKDKLLTLFDGAISEMEDDYLYINKNGTPYSLEQKENAQTLHILKSLASALDSHTAFFSQTEAYDMKVRLKKEFEGIGVVLQQTPDGIIISSVVDGGPAAKSGQIKAQDRIQKINGLSIAGKTLSTVMELMRGSKGSPIELTLSRTANEDGNKKEENIVVKLKREPISVSNERLDVQSEKFGNGLIGMITLHSFYQGEDGSGSDTDLKKAIEDLDKQGNLRGLILDLRENSGGFLTQAVKVAGLFISNGVVVISKYSDGEEKLYRDVDNTLSFDGPLVILTSKATASAAEIVAQALQDYGVAIIVGDDRTYGKGTIQSQTVTGQDKASSFFKVTVGKYYTVSGKTPQLQGVKSDIVVMGPYSHEKIGEEYLDHPLQPDLIKPEYNDSLTDIDPGLKSWYLKYYTPTLQHKISEWTDMLPVLKKNSAYRISNNKNYQAFLKQLGQGEINMELFKQTNKDAENKNDKNFGSDDIQMQEALNIVKDMIYLQNKNRKELNLAAPHATFAK